MTKPQQTNDAAVFSQSWKQCVSANSEAERQIKKLLIWVKFAFWPSKKMQKRIFPQNTFFPKTGQGDC
jgi:hypothetical protein